MQRPEPMWSPQKEVVMDQKRSKMSRRQFISGAAAIVGGSTLWGAGIRKAGAASSQKITLRLSHSWAPDPVQAPGHINALKFQELVQQKSQGQLTIQIFPASQLGEERAAAEGIKMGTVDLMTSGTAIWANFAPKLGVCDLPYLFTTFAQAKKVLTGPAADDLGQYLGQATGARLLGFWGSPGFRNVATKSKEVKSLDDLKGLKVRVIQTPTYIRTFELLGASPTPMAFGEVYLGIQTGVIDGWEHDAPTMASAKMYEVTKYLARTEHLYGVCVMTGNSRKIDALPPELKKVLVDAAHEACSYMFDIAAPKEEEGLKVLRDKGMIIHPFEKGPAKEKVKGYWAEYADKVKATEILAKMTA
jgi:tripartite ATP-independent transporter DctP family solute receptor